VQKVDGRWYGIGVFTMMAHPDMYTDAQLNRINQKDSRSASATFYYPDASPLWKSGKQPELGSNDMVPLSINWDPNKPPIFRENLQEKAELGMELMRQVRQAADNEFGIQSAAGASSLDQNRSDTATGIMNIERDANLVSRDNMYDISAAIEEVLWQAVEMELEHMDEQVVAFSQDGSELATLNRGEIRALDKQVRLLLTKSRSSEAVATNQAARAAWLQYMRLNPREQYFGRDFYLNEMKAYECNDADQRLPEVTQEEMMAWVKAQSEQKPPEKPVSESIAIKLAELHPSEREQALAKAGIKASPPAEVAADQAQRVQIERAEKAPFPSEKTTNEPEPPTS